MPLLYAQDHLTATPPSPLNARYTLNPSVVLYPSDLSVNDLWVSGRSDWLVLYVESMVCLAVSPAWAKLGPFAKWKTSFAYWFAYQERQETLTLFWPPPVWQNSGSAGCRFYSLLQCLFPIIPYSSMLVCIHSAESIYRWCWALSTSGACDSYQNFHISLDGSIVLHWVIFITGPCCGVLTLGWTWGCSCNHQLWLYWFPNNSQIKYWSCIVPFLWRPSVRSSLPHALLYSVPLLWLLEHSFCRAEIVEEFMYSM